MKILVNTFLHELSPQNFDMGRKVEDEATKTTGTA